MKNKKNVLIILSIVAFIIVVGGISFSYFVYNKNLGDVSINTGEISINYSDVNGNMSLTGIIPKSDNEGKISGDYIDFSVDGIVDTDKIYYELSIVPNSGNTLDTQYIKTYLTDQSDNVISGVTAYNNLLVNEKETGKRLYRETIDPNQDGTKKTYTKDFRLRVWLDESYSDSIAKTFEFNVNLYAKNIENEYVIPDLKNMIARKASTVSYIASYDDIITSNPTFTTQDQVTTSSPKQTVYYFTGDDAAANANVLFAGYCWQIVRTTDNGGVRMIYNGVAKKSVTLTTETIADTDITYTNDGTYPYTYDSTTKKWTSTNHTNSATGTFIFTVKEAGDYAINYNVSSEANYDKVKIYKNNTLIKEDSGTKEDSIELGTLTTTNEIKVEYTKDSSSSSGNDNVIFEIGKVTNRVESENLQCQPNRTATKGINGTDGDTSTSLSGTSLFGRSYDYNLDTGVFTLQDSTGLPTSWNDTNYKDLIGTYTCKSNSSTCTTLYYVGSYASSTSARTSSYTIGDVAHFSQLGTSSFNHNYGSPALVGYMFNEDYNYKSGNKEGEYFTTAVWENGAYTLSSGNGGTAPDATHHYICDSDCTKVRYYYCVRGSSYYYILLENGMTIEDALYQMTGYGNATTLSKPINANYELNNYNSAIKGYLDNWYKKNLTGYTSYLDETSVYCNDRSISDLGGWNPSGTSLNEYLQFKQYNENIDLNCVNETDRFAVTNSKAELAYPIGLLTEPERNLMTANFAKTGQYYWGASPSVFSNYHASVRSVNNTGVNNISDVYYSFGARAVISLKPGTDFDSGTGTYDNPYVVGPLVTRTN